MKSPLLRPLFFTITTFCIVTVLSGCSQKPVTVLPTGPQTLTGALSPVELSLTRRGTHILRQNGHDVYYIESTVVNLRSLEGMDVTLTGVLEKNSDAASLPVLVATSAAPIEEPSHPWSVPALHLTFTAPLSWEGNVFDDGVSFTQTGSTHALLKILHSSLAALPAGTPLVVGGERAVRVDAGSGQVIYVQNGSDIVAMTIDQTLQGPTGSKAAQSLLHILKSIAFTSASSSGSGAVKTTGSGAMAGVPCGGVAGILCPSGSYCAISDQAQGIGVCRSLTPGS